MACYKVPLSGPVGTPVSGGVAIVSPDFSVSARWKPISRYKPRKTKDFKECWAGTPPHFSCYTPPFVSVTKNKRSFVTRKTPQIGSLKPAPSTPAPKTGLPGTSNSRQSRPLSQAPPLREVFVTFHGTVFAGLDSSHRTVLKNSIVSIAHDCITNRADLLLHRQPR